MAFALTAAAVRVAMLLLGVRFDFLTASAYWQFLDLELLKIETWTSLNYLHAQPPLMNLMTAAALQLGDTWGPRVLHLMSLAIGVVLCLIVFDLASRWFRSFRVAWICGLWVALNPTYVIYEHNYFYTGPMAFLLAAAGWCLWRYFADGGLVFFAAYAAALLAMLLTRSMYQPVWLAVNLGWPFLLRRPTRELMFIASAALVLGLTWPLKNLMVFGAFSTSSWSGMNMYNAVYNQYYEEAEVEAIYAGESLPPRQPEGADSTLAAIRPFNSPEVYLAALGEQKPTGQPAVGVLDNIYRRGGNYNFNHWIYLQASKAYARDYLKVIQKRPSMIAEIFISSLGYYFRPATHNDVLLLTPVSTRNLEVLSLLDAAYRRTFYGQWTSVCFTVIAATVIVFVAVPVVFRRKSGSIALRALLVFAWINVGYVFVIGNLFENYENMRFRFETEPLLALALLALVAAHVQSHDDEAHRAIEIGGDRIER